MKIYRIWSECMMGFENNVQYRKNIGTATQCFNDLVRKLIKETDFVDEEDFQEKIQYLRESIEEFHPEREIICRKYPVLMYKEGNKIVARIYFWQKTSYEYNEWDVERYEAVLQEIEITK